MATPSLKFLLPIPTTRVGARSECAQGKPNVGKKKLAIMAMPLPKMGGKKNSGCRNYMWGIKKKKCYVYNIFTTFSQQITGN